MFSLMANINIGEYNEKLASTLGDDDISTTIKNILHLENVKNDEQNLPVTKLENIEDITQSVTSIPKTDKILFDDVFKLPIEYINNATKHSLSINVAADLELYEVNDATVSSKTSQSKKNMYEYLFQPTHVFAKQMTEKWGKSFSSNIDFLKDTQKVLLNTAFIKNKNTFQKNDVQTNMPNEKREPAEFTTSEMCNGIIDVWKDIKEDGTFLERYGYMDWSYLIHLNESPSFLQCLMVVNLMSPLTSLILPIIILLFPFLLLKIQGVPIDFNTYSVVLKEIAKNHFIGKMFQLSSLSYDKIIYFLFTIALYFLQIYQNIKYCISFYKNIQKIHRQLYDVKAFISIAISNMEIFIQYNSGYTTYTPFIEETGRHLEHLTKLAGRLEKIQCRDCQPIFKITQLGYIYELYYQLYSNKEYEMAIKYAFGFEGYIDNLLGVYDHFSNYSVSKAMFLNNDAETTGKLCIKEQYYPPYVNKIHVDNDCNITNNMIITGVNASGKTTYLKTTTLNILFSQQIGFGFYQSMEIAPYTHIHSYLNIPDTSDRDSLFQAESRRCKEILDIIRPLPNCKNYAITDRHFCIFDELYSGTNPLEASKSAYAFLLYLSRFSNVDFILTTHYTKICKKLVATTTKNTNGKYKRQIENFQMEAIPSSKEKDVLEYTYKIKDGVCDIQGALQVLRDMNYPPEIIEEYIGYSSRKKTKKWAAYGGRDPQRRPVSKR